MMTNKAYKFRIYPNQAQAILINKTIGCSRLYSIIFYPYGITHTKRQEKA
ncbi:Uncharacterized protein BC10311_00879 [Bacillus wiedmannii]|uniref:Transposase putative helix-turn-helix domain-containing protein n=1 Tax=Bacillus wiedmannii TaxID=1890302 RepID=A0AB37YLE7_9BACI|nr:Uncharacterized protein BC10311_00879 [Bacillus wiedmannii]